VITGVVLLVAIFRIQLALSVHRNSFTRDEDDHIYSGYMSRKHGDCGLNPKHPPLVKLVAALPLLYLPVKLPALQNRFFKLEGFLGGKEFFFNNDAEECCSGRAWRRGSSRCCWRYWCSWRWRKCLAPGPDS
jgi:hypothetical protein